MGFDKTELLQNKKVVVSSLKKLQKEIELLEDQFNDYIQYLSDEEKEDAMEKWEDKQDELFELSDSLSSWLTNSKSIK